VINKKRKQVDQMEMISEVLSDIFWWYIRNQARNNILNGQDQSVFEMRKILIGTLKELI
jgi:hypothetical protein